jgi:hypothetical protein
MRTLATASLLAKTRGYQISDDFPDFLWHGRVPPAFLAKARKRMYA